MKDENPYEAPKAKIYSEKDGYQEILQVAKGQKNIIYAVLLYIFSAFLQEAIGNPAKLFSLIAIGLSIYGFSQISRGLGYSIIRTLLLCVLLLIPLINLLTLLVINSKATKALRGSGYQVGFLGAKIV